MNKNGVLTSKREVSLSGASEYQFPTEDVAFTGRLDSRSWGKKFCLVCNFTADDGKKYKLIAYGNRGHYGNVYGPKGCAYDFAEKGLEGCKFTCTVRMNSRGRHTWVSAE